MNRYVTNAVDQYGSTFKLAKAVTLKSGKYVTATHVKYWLKNEPPIHHAAVISEMTGIPIEKLAPKGYKDYQHTTEIITRTAENE